MIPISAEYVYLSHIYSITTFLILIYRFDKIKTSICSIFPLHSFCLTLTYYFSGIIISVLIEMTKPIFSRSGIFVWIFFNGLSKIFEPSCIVGFDVQINSHAKCSFIALEQLGFLRPRTTLIFSSLKSPNRGFYYFVNYFLPIPASLKISAISGKGPFGPPRIVY